VVELAIRDLKDGAGLEHVPSVNFHANSAWLHADHNRTPAKIITPRTPQLRGVGSADPTTLTTAHPPGPDRWIEP